MIALLKALIPAGLLTWIIAGIIGSNGSKGGFLSIQQLQFPGGMLSWVAGTYWSWPLFIASWLLAFAIFKMME